MKKIIKFFSRHFAKQKTFSSLFSEAVSEGIQETYKEMGYRFDINEDLGSIKNKIEKYLHSVYPLCDGDIDNIQGVVYIKDM